MLHDDGSEPRIRLELAPSDPAELEPLHRWMRDQPGIDTRTVPREPALGELGVTEFLEIIAGSGGLISALKVLPAFIRSRRSDIYIKIDVKRKKFEVDAKNVDDVLPIIERLLDDSTPPAP